MTRPRKTRLEMIEVHKAKLAKLEAQEAGSYQDEGENGMLKALKNRLRKTNTALRAAGITLNGTEKGRAPISKKIADTLKRLETQRTDLENAEAFISALPLDIQRLEAAVAAAETGEDVEFPEGLTHLTADENRSDGEHEAAFIAAAETEEVDLGI